MKLELCPEIIFFLKKNSQINPCFKIMSKLVSYCHITKTVISDYGFIFIFSKS